MRKAVTAHMPGVSTIVAHVPITIAAETAPIIADAVHAGAARGVAWIFIRARILSRSRALRGTEPVIFKLSQWVDSKEVNFFDSRECC